MSRKSAREEAFKLVFEIEGQKAEPSEVLSFYYDKNKLKENDKAYIDNVAQGVFENMPLINDTIVKQLVDWKMERISKVSLALLRLGTYELLKRPDIPVSVSVNEVVELAKKYEGQDAAAFINGVLGSIEKSEQMVKETK